MSVNLPRETRGVLRAVQERNSLTDPERWWVHDDLGPFDGPHPTAKAAWDRVVELNEAEQAAWLDSFKRQGYVKSRSSSKGAKN